MKAATAAALLSALAALVACGVPLDREAEVLNDVPFGLSDPERAPEPSPAPIEGSGAQIFLVDPSRARLAPVERRVREPTLPAVVDTLLDGPTRAESRQGLTTAFANGKDVIKSVSLIGGVAEVDLAQSFTTSDGTQQRLAIAQLVLTATGRPGVGRVSFTLEGQPVDVPRGDGTLVSGSVSRDDYRELLPA